MVFSSTTFLFFLLPIALILYYGVPLGIRYKNTILVFISLLFYAFGEPVYVWLMIGSIVINWGIGLLIEKRNINLFFIVGLLINIANLFVFKYLTWILGLIGIKDFPELTLPIGISFYTFQAMSYLIDIKRGQVKAQRNVLDVMLYISFFAQLVAGPIVRYDVFANQIKGRTNTWNHFIEGMKRFIYGLGKKVILANTMGEVSGIVFDSLNIANNSMSIWTAWIGAIAFSLQIYFDFSGYSDMAIGIGKMFGFTFPENFNYPYMADSITDFWRRWHISLSSWFRDYVYIPCGGNRKGAVRTIINILIVWSLTGLWHGANFSFVLWGFLYGVLLIVEKNFLKKNNPVISRIYTLVFVIIGWVIFNSTSIGSAFVYVKTMFGIGSTGIWNLLAAKALIGEFKWYFVLAIAGCFPIYKRIQSSKLYSKTVVICIEDIYVLILFGLSVCSIVNGAYNPFIYFNF